MKPNSPKVSIVVAAYNAEAAIDKTIQSILDQDYASKEIIVIDGGSKDSTFEKVQAYGTAIDYKISERDNGIADAYNKGIRAARGEWLYFLNADDIFVSPSTLSQVFSAIGDDNTMEIVAGSVISDDGRLFNGRFDWRLLIRNQVHHQAIFYRAPVLVRLPYNTAYRSYGHDHEHNLHIWRKKLQVRYLPIQVALWARGGISDKADWRQYKEEFKVRKNSVGRLGYFFNIFSFLRFSAKKVRLAFQK